MEKYYLHTYVGNRVMEAISQSVMADLRAGGGILRTITNLNRVQILFKGVYELDCIYNSEAGEFVINTNCPPRFMSPSVDISLNLTFDELSNKIPLTHSFEGKADLEAVMDFIEAIKGTGGKFNYITLSDEDFKYHEIVFQDSVYNIDYEYESGNVYLFLGSKFDTDLIKISEDEKFAEISLEKSGNNWRSSTLIRLLKA